MRYTIFCFICFLIITSCSKKGNITPSVAICFDDDHIEQWYNHKDLFEKHNAKVTFCISNFSTLDSTKKNKLLALYKNGHAIANHSLTHKNPKQYIDEYNINQYLKLEVDSAQKIFNTYGYNPTSYILPFGIYTKALLDSLSIRYNKIRGGIYNIPNRITGKKKTLDNYENIFITDSNQIFINSMGIDYNYGNHIALIKPALEKCKEDSLCLVLYAHKIDTSNKNYTISPLFLDSLFTEINKLKLKYTTLN